MFNVPLLPRPRLTELIDRATRHKVVLVCGPAGAGKTVACAEWAAAASGNKRVAWLTLRADEDRAWFWADLAGRHAPGISLDRLRAYGELATVGAADLACTPDEADAYLTMASAEFPRPGRGALSVREKCFISELRPTATYGAAAYGAAVRGAAAYGWPGTGGGTTREG